MQLKKPSIVAEEASLYMQKPPSLEVALRKNLDIPLSELIESGEVVYLTVYFLNFAFEMNNVKLFRSLLSCFSYRCLQ